MAAACSCTSGTTARKTGSFGSWCRAGAGTSAVLDQICRAEIEQIAHRLRPVRRTSENSTTIYILTEVPVDLSVDELVTFEGVIPDAHDMLLARGIYPEGWPLTHTLLGDRFVSPNAAKVWFRDHPDAAEKRSQTLVMLKAQNRVEFPLKSNKGKSTRFCRWRLKWRKGYAQTCWIDLARHPDPAAALARFIDADDIISVEPASDKSGHTGEPSKSLDGDTGTVRAPAREAVPALRAKQTTPTKVRQFGEAISAADNLSSAPPPSRQVGDTALLCVSRRVNEQRCQVGNSTFRGHLADDDFFAEFDAEARALFGDDGPPSIPANDLHYGAFLNAVHSPTADRRNDDAA